ncbi:hypothetical protein BB558_000716 [Smittium angustum]|uniref:Uncharacterized protein n=1 Tax=Smittium angustum TaxID=133377 RepID=A0A2U1JDD8_SMIAN|nr:hypothetical protein BB558_000716 [Smittium angustum]
MQSSLESVELQEMKDEQIKTNDSQNLHISITDEKVHKPSPAKSKNKNKPRSKTRDNETKNLLGLSRYSGVSLVDASEIRILIAGIGKIRKNKWQAWCNAITSNWRIKSDEFVPYMQKVPNYYIGKTRSDSEIRFHYIQDINDEHEDLHAYQTGRQILGIIGVVDFQEIFPTTEKITPSSIKNHINEFAGIVVTALSMMADSIEKQTSKSMDGLERPNEPESTGLFGKSSRVVLEMSKQMSFSSTSDSKTKNLSGRYLSNKGSSKSSLTTGYKTGFGDIKPRKQIDSESEDEYEYGNQSHMDVTETGQGRLKKLEGDLLLMAGRITEAVAAYRLSIEYSFSNEDYVWQASALEGYVTSLVLLVNRQSERSFLVALAMCPPETSVTSMIFKGSIGGTISQSLTNPDNESNVGKGNRQEDPTMKFMGKDGLFALVQDLAERYTEVVLLYEKSYSFAPLLHSEACLRRAVIQMILDKSVTSDDLDIKISRILSREPIDSSPINHLQAHGLQGYASRARWRKSGIETASWIQRGWTQAVMSLKLKDLMNLSAAIAMLFHNSGYKRKEAFFLRQFLLLIQPLLSRNSEKAGSHGLMGANNNRIDIETQKQVVACLGAVSRLYRVENTNPLSKSSVLFKHWTLWLTNNDEIKGLLKNERSGTLTGGWYDLQADVLRECVSIAECIPSYPHAIAGAFRLLSILNTNEYRLLAKYHIGSEEIEDEIRQRRGEQENLIQYLERMVGVYHQRRHFDPNDPRKQRKLLALKTLPMLIAGLDKHASDKLDVLGLVPRVVGRDAPVVGSVINNLLQSIQPYPQETGSCRISTKTTKHSMNDSDSLGTSLSKTDNKPQSLFLYKPGQRGNKSSLGNESNLGTKVTPVSGEIFKFYVTLLNPFSHPLLLTNVQLLVQQPGKDDSKLESHLLVNSAEAIIQNDSEELLAQGVLQGRQVKSIAEPTLTKVVIPPGSLHTVTLTMVPLRPGPAKVVGIQCTIFDYITVSCMLPEPSSEDLKRKLKFEQIRNRISSDLTETQKNSPFHSTLVLATTKPTSGFAIPITILPKQPKLEIGINGLNSASSSLSSVALFEGERVTFSIILQNNGSVPVNFFDIIFEPLEENIREPAFSSDENIKQEPSPLQKRIKQYNVDYQPIDFPISSSFSPIDKVDKQTRINPGQHLSINYTLLGQHGCSGATIKVVYGSSYIYSDQEEPKLLANQSVDSNKFTSFTSYTRETFHSIKLQINKVLVPSFQQPPCKVIPIPQGIHLFKNNNIVTSDNFLSMIQNNKLNSSLVVSELVKSLEELQTPRNNRFFNTKSTNNRNPLLKHQQYTLYQFLSKHYCLATFCVDNVRESSIDVCFEIKLSLPTKNVGDNRNSKLDKSQIIENMVISIPAGVKSYKVLIPVNRVKLCENQLFTPIQGLDYEAEHINTQNINWSVSFDDEADKCLLKSEENSKDIELGDPNTQENIGTRKTPDENVSTNTHSSANTFGSTLSSGMTPSGFIGGFSKNDSLSKRQYIAPQGPKLSNVEKMEIRRFYNLQKHLYDVLRVKYFIISSEKFGYINPKPFLEIDESSMKNLVCEELEISSYAFSGNNKLLSGNLESETSMSKHFDKDIISEEPKVETPVSDIQNPKTGVDSFEEAIAVFKKSLDCETLNGKSCGSDEQVLTLKPNYYGSSCSVVCHTKSHSVLLLNILNGLLQKVSNVMLTINLVNPPVENIFYNSKQTLVNNPSYLTEQKDNDLSSTIHNHEPILSSNVPTPKKETFSPHIYDTSITSDQNEITDGLAHARTKASSHVARIAAGLVPTSFSTKQFFSVIPRKQSSSSYTNSPSQMDGVLPDSSGILDQSSPIPESRVNDNVSIDKSYTNFSKNRDFCIKRVPTLTKKRPSVSRRIPGSNSPQAQPIRISNSHQNPPRVQKPLGHSTNKGTILLENRNSRNSFSISGNTILESSETQILDPISEKVGHFKSIEISKALKETPLILWNPVSNYKLPLLKEGESVLLEVPLFIVSSGRYVFEYELTILPNNFDGSSDGNSVSEKDTLVDGKRDEMDKILPIHPLYTGKFTLFAI